MTSISDNFNRANSSALGTDWAEDSGDFSIVNNTLRQVTVGGSYRKCRWVGTAMASDNYDVEVDGRSAGNGFGAFGRGVVGATVTYYSGTGFPGDAFYLLEITGGAEGVLATGGTCNTGTTYNVRLRNDGSSHTVFVNDVSTLGPITDTSLASGAVGCMSYDALNGDNDWNDNFAAADLAGGPVTYNETGGAIATGQARGIDANIFNETGASRSPASGRGIDANVFGE